MLEIIMKIPIIPALAVLLSTTLATAQEYNKGINIIPIPLQLKETQQAPFNLTLDTTISASGEQAEVIAQFFAEKLRASTGFPLKVMPKDGAISLSIDESLDSKPEGYKLSVTSKSVSIVGKDAAGLFYGMQSFLQLFPAEIASLKKVEGITWQAPTVEITDAPRFGYRGVMLDVCRHFQSVECIKRQIDVLSMFKMNRLHWHLTEDQGWRIEIKKYPKLTEIGAQRVEGEGFVYKGFYTQEEVKDIVAYAAARQITIIPEFELPGHELAAIAAYPELSCKNSKVTPRIIWGVEDIVMCPAKDLTFRFIEDVIDEMAPLFPGEYFHVGGDECPKTSWKNCPACQEFIKKNNLQAKDGHSAEERLQSYVIGRAEKMLAKHGKKLIGWDEILEGGLSPNATVMSWRGEKGGIEAAMQGHDVVMTPNSHLYLDHFQGDSSIEPVAIGGFSPLAHSYSYDPIPAQLKENGKGHHVLGVQGNLWSEYMYTDQLMEYRLYPRALAIAEIGWSMPEKKNFQDFSRRVNNASVRMDAYGINYHIPQPEQEITSNHLAFTDKMEVAFRTTRPIKMVYTLDGSEPTPQSTEYTKPLVFTETSLLKICSVMPSGKMSPVRNIRVEKQQLAPAQNVADAKAGLKMTVIPGKYINMKQLAASKSTPQHRVVTALDQIKVGNEDHSTISEGYINIPEDGVYLFRTNNNQLWIDGKLIVDNDGEVKRFSRNAGAIALSKGMHAVKVVWLGNIIGGWPSNWDNAEVSFQNLVTKKKAVVQPVMLFH